ncbi:hypothetical protein BpHYR1_051357 [Brachionus plicatilis]|uniref:Uncharacterized protein n=1 Tax=Brachionus plicatilis TaxID=10195 RepID=A0A3M7S623_BRAPC|nr:hypothetical protein BpHYR1_051357 [Brachionus plicatilis]
MPLDFMDKEKNNLRLIRLRIYKDFPPIIAAFFNFVYQLSPSFLYLEKTTEHDFSTDIFIFHLISYCSSSLKYTCQWRPLTQILVD